MNVVENAKQVASEIDDYLQTIEDQPWGNQEVLYTKAIDAINRLIKLVEENDNGRTSSKDL